MFVECQDIGRPDDGSTNYHVALSDEEVNAAVDLWLARDKNPATRREVRQMCQDGMVEELRALMLNRLEFGTAGLRGRMGAGYAQMNDLVIVQTSQGLAQYLLKNLPENGSKSVVIGYDGRYNSRKFAELTAVAMLLQDFKVYLFSKLCPTPFVPYAVRHYSANCGIMVTASHNPKEDNGYKVYWANSASIISPHDKRIQESILENLNPLPNAWDTSKVVENTLDPLEDVMKSYFDEFLTGTHYFNHNVSTPLRFTYTPMHGVGQEYMKHGFEVAGFKPFVSVALQMDPNPDFPTVKFPNPEEGKSALDLSIQTADQNNCSVILANDPDADRLAVAEKCADGSWKIFNGNELGALLGWWSYELHIAEMKKNEESFDKQNCYMLASTVSSKVLKTMAHAEGFKFIETLTGFKWMGNKAFDLMANDPKAKVLFAYEEAIGFMMGTQVLDKDGISAGVRMAELCAYLNVLGLTLQQKLEQLYEKYGYHLSENSYFGFKDLRNIKNIQKNIFHDLRTREPFEGSTFYTETHRYPQSLLKGKYEIISVRDLTTGYDSTQPDKRAILPISNSSQMITFEFSNGFVATLRTSGTEPKVKYYTELKTPSGDKDLKKWHGVLREMVDALVAEFLQPERFGLAPRVVE